ncbi:MAG: hypothetical protein JSS27_18305 [Planctomycetes bacterium]|nr:hypothetical protein [Planctomycetota bacterium]
MTFLRREASRTVATLFMNRGALATSQGAYRLGATIHGVIALPVRRVREHLLVTRVIR